jgi:hypothetical protein
LKDETKNDGIFCGPALTQRYVHTRSGSSCLIEFHMLAIVEYNADDRAIDSSWERRPFRAPPGRIGNAKLRITTLSSRRMRGTHASQIVSGVTEMTPARGSGGGLIWNAWSGVKSRDDRMARLISSRISIARPLGDWYPPSSQIASVSVAIARSCSTVGRSRRYAHRSCPSPNAGQKRNSD